MKESGVMCCFWVQAADLDDDQIFTISVSLSQVGLRLGFFLKKSKQGSP